MSRDGMQCRQVNADGKSEIRNTKSEVMQARPARYTGGRPAGAVCCGRRRPHSAEVQASPRMATQGNSCTTPPATLHRAKSGALAHADMAAEPQTTGKTQW